MSHVTDTPYTEADLAKIGRRIAALRERESLRQSDVVLPMQSPSGGTWSSSYVSNVEHGALAPCREFLQQVCELFAISMRQLLPGHLTINDFPYGRVNVSPGPAVVTRGPDQKPNRVPPFFRASPPGTSRRIVAVDGEEDEVTHEVVEVTVPDEEQDLEKIVEKELEKPAERSATLFIEDSAAPRDGKLHLKLDDGVLVMRFPDGTRVSCTEFEGEVSY